ncbi:MAG: Flp pilus assembly complex ATPase component TadA [Bdellovibrionales bacterium]|nr:Flp pilus assembly complex ATPase component TadA [Bdellovibrionales bacterium]
MIAHSELLLAFKSIEKDLSEEIKAFQIHKDKDLRIKIEQRVKSWPAPLAKRILDELFGLGPLEPLLNCQKYSEVIVGGFDRIWLKEGVQLKLSSEIFLSHWTFTNAISKILSECQCRTDFHHATANGNFRGYRIHVAQKPLVEGDYEICFRRHFSEPWSLDEMEARGALTAFQKEYIESLLIERKTFFVV